jgi:S-adenosylmethionine:tRNA ribosyltransferase-isomerase
MLNPQPVRIPVATAPPEARGLARDQVRMLVSRRSSGDVLHTTFKALPDFLDPGDLIVVNESGTLAAALQAHLRDGSMVRLHLSTRLPSGRWVVEIRRPDGLGSRPFGPGLRHGQRLRLPAGGIARLMRPYGRRSGTARLWEARLDLPSDAASYLALHGAPIRYTDGEVEWPLRFYQTVFGRVPGSAEMASAGRAFSPETLADLRKRGVSIAGLVLHTGVSSLESGEAPYSEWYRVPHATADAVNRARAAGKRVLAIGTTVVRALESSTDPDGISRASEGWTDLMITPERGLRGDLAMLTGFHEPESSHLAMLEAVAGPAVIRHGYSAALAGGYLWHEFGDLHLIL